MKIFSNNKNDKNVNVYNLNSDNLIGPGLLHLNGEITLASDTSIKAQIIEKRTEIVVEPEVAKQRPSQEKKWEVEPPKPETKEEDKNE